MSRTDEITVRPATQADAALVHSMIVALAKSAPGKITLRSTPANFETALAGDNPAIRALIAMRADTPVGLVAFFTTFSTWYGATGVYVQDLYVADETRGLGIGRRLMAEVARWASAHGATHVRLSVDRDNVSAQAFYERTGMAYRDDEMIYMIDGDAFRRLGADA